MIPKHDRVGSKHYRRRFFSRSGRPCKTSSHSDARGKFAKLLLPSNSGASDESSDDSAISVSTLGRGSFKRYRRRFFYRSRKGQRNRPSEGNSEKLPPPSPTTVCESSSDSRKSTSIEKCDDDLLLLDDSLGAAKVPEVITIGNNSSSHQTRKKHSIGSLIPTDIDSDSGSCSECEKSSLSPISPNSSKKIEQPLMIAKSSPEKMNGHKEDVEKDTVISPRRECNKEQGNFSYKTSAFTWFRAYYLIVHTAIMLADGLQGTHLYVLYKSYGYSVASLYSLGFFSGAFTSPFIGPFVDRIGRKKAAMLYCFLEIIINQMEQYPLFSGLIASRIIGGITTNLLFSVFESWLVTEHRKRGFESEKLEVIMRDSTIASNAAAIVSGYIAHLLASELGAVGPFIGAVVFTGVAFLLVGMLWSENFGSESSEVTTFRSHMVGAYNKIVSDSKISRIGLIQGLTEGSLHTFVFLWSPALHSLSTNALPSAMGLDVDGEPAYGLIFGAFMACGVIGSFVQPSVRKVVSSCRTTGKESNQLTLSTDEGILCALCYLSSALLLLTPCLVKKESPYAFSITLGSFLIYEFMVGLYMPCEGVLRSIFMPNESICSLMTMLRVIVNVAVAVGVMSTNFVSFPCVFSSLCVMMLTATCLQLSLIQKKD